MIAYFKANFRPGAPDGPDSSLAITGGRGGARLTHSHDRWAAERGRAGPIPRAALLRAFRAHALVSEAAAAPGTNHDRAP